jgi:cardiolipin synthase
MDVGRNRVSLLLDGRQAFPAMLNAIAQAKSTICLETYILRDDHTGRRFAAALAERARAGVEVNLLYDAWGSSVSEPFLQALGAAGVRTHPFHRVGPWSWPWTFLARILRRDHRKSLVVDGRVAFLGGLNISDDYAAPEDGGAGWRDTHVRVEGPAALQLQALFLRTWRRHMGARLDRARYARPGPPDRSLRIVASDFRLRRRGIRRAYLAAIGYARHEVLITQAYFLPPLSLLRAILQAARRGVEVRIILAGTTDVPLVLYAVRAMYERFLRAGVRIFEWRGRVLHAKTAVVDSRWATVGSSNLDAMSFFGNLEVNAVVEDPAFARALEEVFADDLTHCVEIKLADVQRRGIVDRIAFWLAYLLRQWL